MRKQVASEKVEINIPLMSDTNNSGYSTEDEKDSSVFHSKLQQENLLEQTSIQIDEGKVIQKEVKIQYREQDVSKRIGSGPGETGKPAKQKFDWKLYKRLLAYVKREKKLAVVIYSSLLIANISQTFIPYMIGELLNDVTQEKDAQSSVNENSWIFLGLILVTTIFGFIRVASSNLLGLRVMQSLKIDIFSQFLSNDITFFEKYKTGDLMSRIGRDVATAKSAVSFNSTMLLRNVLLTFSNFVMLFVISWKVTLSIVPIFPIYYTVTKLYTLKSKEIEKKVSDISAASSSLAEEIFSGIMTVKAFDQIPFETKKYQKILADEYKEGNTQSILNAIFFTINNTLLANIGILIILWYGGYIVTQHTGELNSGDLASFILYSTALATNSSAISFGLSSIVSAMGALDRIFEMMEYVPKIDETKGDSLGNISGSVQLKNVAFAYPKDKSKTPPVQILHGITIEILPGQCVAFVGTSGSGKSTIVKLIERFYDPTSGSICIDNKDLKNINVPSIRAQIGLVSQEPLLFSGSILDNIVYGVSSYTMEDVYEVCVMAGVDEFLKQASIFPKGYDTVVGERGTMLSGGQKQRVAIARALIKRPKILIFDEATSALDSESEYLVQQSIDQLIKKSTITIIIIAHRLSTIQNCTVIHVMQLGKIVESGTHDDLITSEGPYKQLVERQLQQKV